MYFLGPGDKRLEGGKAGKRGGEEEEPLATLEMRHPRLSHWVNNMAVFTIFMMSLGVNSIKAEKKSGNADHYSH